MNMNFDSKPCFYLIANEINWALLWTGIARLAYSIGDIECCTHARKRGTAAYREASRLLGQADNNDKRLISLMGDLEALRGVLDQLFTESTDTWECSCST